MALDVNKSIAARQTAESAGGTAITSTEACDIMRECVRSGVDKLEVARALNKAGVSTADISSALSLSELYYNGASQSPTNGPVDLNSPQAAMAKYTQVDDSSTTSKRDLSQNGCGAGSLVNASLLHGKDGILGLLKVMSKNGAHSALIDDWTSKAENNTLTMKDLRDMQGIVHEQLLAMKKSMGVGNAGTQMVPPAALEKYIKTDVAWVGTDQPLVANMKGARVLFVSTGDGLSDAQGRSGSHFVLCYGYDSPPMKVADTWPRQDGNQTPSPGVYLNAAVGYIDPGPGGSHY
jgi:hypothetical protein